MKNQSHAERLADLRKRAETRSDELLVEAIAELEAQCRLIATLRDELDLSAAIEKALRPKSESVRKSAYTDDLDGADREAVTVEFNLDDPELSMQAWLAEIAVAVQWADALETSAMYHEAGHFVACVVLGGEVVSATVEPQSTAFARVQTQGGDPEHVAVIAAAGIASVTRAGIVPRDDEEERSDREHVPDNARWAAALEQADALLAEHWEFVEEVVAAFRLEPTLSAETLARLNAIS